MLIRIKSFFGITIGFHEISNTVINKDTLIINKHNGDKESINLHFIDPTDAQKLKGILDEKSRVHQLTEQ